MVRPIGWLHQGTLNTNEEFGPATNTWTTAEPMPAARHAVALATLGESIHVFGGGQVVGYSVTNMERHLRYEESDRRRVLTG